MSHEKTLSIAVSFCYLAAIAFGWAGYGLKSGDDYYFGAGEAFMCAMAG